MATRTPQQKLDDLIVQIKNTVPYVQDTLAPAIPMSALYSNAQGDGIVALTGFPFDRASINTMRATTSNTILQALLDNAIAP